MAGQMNVIEQKQEVSKLWGGRFTGEADPIMENLNKSIHIDKRLWSADIKGSQAYVKSLCQIQLVSEEECNNILEGLHKIHEEWENNAFIIQPSDEDIHTANERRLKEIIGSQIGGKLHTGRSRNDQVATDMRIWMKENLKNLKELLLSFIEVLCYRADREIHVLMPGYTHLQRAQPVRWSHWILSYAWYLQQDVERLNDVLKRVDVLPLGSGALAGNPFQINRNFLAQELGFHAVSPNSMQAVGDRDFIAEFLFWASMTAVHLSRLSEDLILYNSKEFGFVSLSDAFSTGSSLMPQKKNPDSLELIRGKAGRIIGNCTGMLITLKGLPSTYNKDLQEDKENLFGTYDMLEAMLKVGIRTFDTLMIHPEACADALSGDMLATDIAYYLVRKGVPFREAHHIAGKAVAMAEKLGCAITDLTLENLQSISANFEEDVSAIWNYEHSVEQYQTTGGTGRASIEKQLKMLNVWISSQK